MPRLNSTTTVSLSSVRSSIGIPIAPRCALSPLCPRVIFRSRIARPERHPCCPLASRKFLTASGMQGGATHPFRRSITRQPRQALLARCSRRMARKAGWLGWQGWRMLSSFFFLFFSFLTFDLCRAKRRLVATARNDGL